MIASRLPKSTRSTIEDTIQEILDEQHACPYFDVGDDEDLCAVCYSAQQAIQALENLLGEMDERAGVKV